MAQLTENQIAHVATVMADGKPQVTPVWIDTDGDAHIDAMAKKYLGHDTYPFRREGEQRVIVRVTPEKVTG